MTSASESVWIISFPFLKTSKVDLMQTRHSAVASTAVAVVVEDEAGVVVAVEEEEEGVGGETDVFANFF